MWVGLEIVYTGYCQREKLVPFPEKATSPKKEIPTATCVHNLYSIKKRYKQKETKKMKQCRGYGDTTGCNIPAKALVKRGV